MSAFTSEHGRSTGGVTSPSAAPPRRARRPLSEGAAGSGAETDTEPETDTEVEPETDPIYRTTVSLSPSLDRWSPPTSTVDRSQMTDATEDLGEVLDEQPGLRVSRLGGLGAFATASVRGSTAEQVLVTVDGVPLGGAAGGPVDLGALPLGPLDSVAIYRGHAPLALGPSAIGGAIALRTRRLTGPAVELEAGGGSFGTRVARGFLGWGADDEETGERLWGVGVAVDYLGSLGDFTFTHDGGTAFDATDDATQTRENAEFDQVALTAKADVRLGDGLWLTALQMLSWRDGGLPGHALFETEQAASGHRRSLTGLRLEADGLGGSPWQLAAVASLRAEESRLDDPLGELGGARIASRDVSLVPGALVAARARYAFGTHVRSPATEDAPTELEPWLELAPTLAASWRLDRFAPGGADVPQDAGPTVSTRHVLTAGAELELHLVPASLALVASGRFEGAWTETAAPTLQPGSTDYETDRATLEDYAARVALAWRGLPGTTLQVGVGRGLRLPSLFELFGDTGYALGNPRLGAERALTVDASAVHIATWLPPEVGLAVELHGFHSQVDGLIQAVQNAQNISRPENLASATLAGAELGLVFNARVPAGTLTTGARARAAVSYLHAVDTSGLAGRDGKRLPFRPAWQAFLRVEPFVDLTGATAGALGELAARVELEHLSANARDRANLVTTEARWLLAVGLRQAFWDAQLHLDVAASNLLDSRVQDFAGFPLPGPTVMATLRWTPDVTPW